MTATLHSTGMRPGRFMYALILIGVSFVIAMAGVWHTAPPKPEEPSTDLPATVENSGSAEVDVLVVKLVSKRPAPHPTGHFTVRDIAYITPEVDAAMKELTKMGPKIYPALITHLRDDRYSFSAMINGWVNFKVGDAVKEVLSEGTRCPDEYLARNTPSGYSGCPVFEVYLDKRKPQEWAAWAKDRTRSEIQLDYLQWGLDYEKAHGFVDEAQRQQIVERYEKALREATQEQRNPKR